MKHPLAWIVAVFSFGILFASIFRINFEITYCAAAIFLLLSIAYSKHRSIFIICIGILVFMLGSLYFKNSQLLPKNHISRLMRYQENNFFAVQGLVNNEPLVTENRTSFVFKVQEVQSESLKQSCCGDILVTVKEKNTISYGDLLILKGRIFRPYRFNNARRQSYRDYLAHQGIFVLMRVRSASEIVTLACGIGWGLRSFAINLKRKIEEIIFSHASFLSASILDAMVLGEKRNIPPRVINIMVKSGTVHILVVSGFNVGIVAVIMLLGLKLIRIPKKIRLGMAIAGIVIYCLITGASTPVVRATVMAIVFMLSFLVKREPDIYNSLGLGLLFILMLNPQQLFDIGLQLSFSSVIAIAYLYPKLSVILRLGDLKFKPIKIIAEGCLVSFSAWLGTVGIIAYYFRIFSPVTVLANLFIVPLATFITLCGFSLVFVHLILPPLAPFFGVTSEAAVSLLLRINSFLANLPWASFNLS